MTKRKRDYFTDLEDVPKWFEVGEGSTATTEETDQGANRIASSEDSTALSTGRTGPASANWPLELEGPLGQGPGESGLKGADWTSSLRGPTGRTKDEVALGSAYVAPSWTLYQRTDSEEGPPREVQPRPSWTAELDEWLGAPRPTVEPTSTEVTPSLIEGSSDPRSLALNAFWSLLMAAGYEEV